MRHVRHAALGILLASVTVTTAATRFRSAPRPELVVMHQVIAVYLGTAGTDAQSGITTAVRDMKVALVSQTTASGRQFISRGVSLEPSVDGGLKHLALLGPFDEVSVGGNWTNSAVVRYLGNNIGPDRPHAVIPQVVLLERDIREDDNRHLDVGPERELGRYIGTDEISAWVARGAPIPK
jgi:hypothetical protein